ncbi:MAG: hypothetical protein LC721_04405 [Actinobacteria bacterium]|nr:hypothetical protein [Actinomycetota bacterium]
MSPGRAEERPDPTFEITFADGRVEQLDADDLYLRRAYLVAVVYTVAVLSPRAVVVARLRQADVMSVLEL